MWQKLSALPIFAFVVLAEPLRAFAQSTPDSPPSRGYGPGPWHMWGDGYGAFWWGGPIIMILFWVLVIGAIVAMISYFMRGGQHGYGAHMGPPWHAGDRAWGDPAHSAMQILGERFARGEIPKDEYEDKKAALLSGARR